MDSKVHFMQITADTKAQGLWRVFKVGFEELQFSITLQYHATGHYIAAYTVVLFLKFTYYYVYHIFQQKIL